jgi:hypothetical protein
VTALLAAGCGSAATRTGTVPSTQTRSTTQTPTSTVASTAPAQGSTPTAPPAEGPSREVTGTVPDETHLELRAAEQNLQRKRVPYKVLAREPSAGAVGGTWVVCTTNPAPRSHLESGTVVKLIVAPSCH